jgi:hypothetical protein
MIQKIQAFTVQDRGTATEAKVEVQSRFTTPDKAVIYYDLRDPNLTDPAFDSRTNEWVTLPYKILSYKKIIVTGADRNNAVSDTNLASNIVFRDRADLVKDDGIIKGSTLLIAAVSYNDFKEACIFFSKGKTRTFYIDNADFSQATLITGDEDLKTPVKETIYISDGSLVRYWRGKSFDKEFFEFCEIQN